MCIKSPGRSWDSLVGKELPLSHVRVYKAEGPHISPGDYEIPTTMSFSPARRKKNFFQRMAEGVLPIHSPNLSCLMLARDPDSY